MTNLKRDRIGVVSNERREMTHKASYRNIRINAVQRLKAREKVNKIRVKRYHLILSSVFSKYDQLDFMTFRPGEVIDEFWWKYRCDSKNFNLLDLILLAKKGIRHSKHTVEELNSLLEDFALFMIASYTKHYMDEDDSVAGRYLFSDQAEYLKTKVSPSFLRTFLSLEEGRTR